MREFLWIVAVIIIIVSGSFIAKGEDLEPFELRNINGRKTLWLHGTEKQRVTIPGDKAHMIMDSIAKEWDINIEYADIDGDLDKRAIADRLEKVEDDEYKRIIKSSIKINNSNISGYANFSSITFSGYANFNSTTFSGYASFMYATFSGDAFFQSATFGKNTSFNSATFSGDANFNSTTFSGVVDFMDATFSRDVSFSYAIFSKGASFISTVFNEWVYFNYATFSGEMYSTFNYLEFFGYATFSGGTSFARATFGEVAYFQNVAMAHPADFEEVSFKENTLFRGVCNAILGIIGREMPVTKFYNFNTEVVMDGSSNPWLKRYIDDEQWILSWRYRPEWRWLRELLFIAWELTSHCGRSLGLWLFWAGIVVIAFAFIYKSLGIDRISLDIDDLKNKRSGLKLWLPIKYYNSFTEVNESKGNQMGIKGYIYYSVVTLFGFGNIAPRSNWARFFVGTEVVVGYIMLGGLISIFANIFARRS